MPEELQYFKEEFKSLRKIKKHLQVEQQLGLDKNWQPTEWFGADTWCRIVMDCMYDDLKLDHLRIVIDHKTGKIRAEHEQQLDLYAIGAFATAPKNITEVRAELWYLDQGEINEKIFDRADVEKLKKEWAKRAALMFKDRTFKPNPGDACRFCPYRKDKSGHCKY